MVKRLLSDPFNFPPEFFQWIRTKLETDQPLFSSAAIYGFRSTVAAIAAAAAPPAIPIGALMQYSDDIDPPDQPGWLLADNRLLSRTTYALAFGVMGFSYSPVPGADPGSNQFHIPAGQGRLLQGKGTHADVDVMGESDGLVITSRTPRHYHETNVDVIAQVAGAGFDEGTGPSSNPGVRVLSGPTAANPKDTPAFLVVSHIVYVPAG